MKKFRITTLGCKVNRYESEALAEDLESRGWRTSKNGEPADLCVINTCTVTAKAAMQSRQAIRKKIREHPHAKVVATGCYAQVGADALAVIQGLHGIVGQPNKHRIPEFIKGLRKDVVQKFLVEDVSGPLPFEDLPIQRFSSRTRAFLKIQDGCDAFCSYCIVPFARGRSRSLEQAKVMDRIDRLLKNDHQEIVLSGIHIGRYGHDLDPQTSLVHLLREVDRAVTAGRFRLSSIEPMELTEEMIRTVATSERICCHFHIPLQSGDNDTLKTMNRPYNAEEYRERILFLVDAIPQASIGVDVMAGFPGETDRAFENTMRLIEELPVAYLHVFPFSSHPGTVAADLKNAVEPQTIKKRCQQLRRLGREKKHRFYKRFVGTTQEVVIEGSRDRQSGYLKGFTRNYIPVLVDGADTLYNRVVPVQIDHVKNGRVKAQLLP